MEFSVTRISQGFVAPSAPTPVSEILELSVIDRIPVLRCNARTLHVYRHSDGAAARVIRDALSKALVPYYPLAGRLHVSEHNDLQIACSGDGVWFVEALADCTLDSLNYLDDSMLIPYEKLLPNPPQEMGGIQDPLVQMQVTQFGCKGFVIGLIFCHTICDGLGAAQFLNATGEIARGAQNPTTAPDWCRNFLPPRPNSNPLGQHPIPLPLPDYQLEPITIDLSIHKIKDLKQQFHEWSGKTCSTFEIVAALLWRQRNLAVDLHDEEQVKLVFFANCRQIVDPPLPKGFYGNCFFPVTVTATSGAVTKESVLEVVKRIQEGKGELGNEFGKWAKGSDSDPFAPPLEYKTVFLSEWGRLGFMEVDYGWGRPVHIVPIQGNSVIPVGIVCSPPSPKTGVRLMTWCVNKGHLQSLLQHMNPYAQ